MGLRTILMSDSKVSAVEFWWIAAFVFLSVFLLTILNGYLKSQVQTQETTVIRVQTPRLGAKHISDSPYSIHINITHRMHVPEMRLPPPAVAATATSTAAAKPETKKTL